MRYPRKGNHADRTLPPEPLRRAVGILRGGHWLALSNHYLVSKLWTSRIRKHIFANITGFDIVER